MLYMNDVTDFRTSAPNGRYLAVSELTCDCCGDLITSSVPLFVIDGALTKRSVDRAAKELVRLHPHHCFLEAVEWDGGGSFSLTFGS